MTDSQDTDKLEGVIARTADFIMLVAERLKDGWQWLGDSTALGAFFLEKETRDVLSSFKEIAAEAKDLKAYEIAGLVKTAAARAEKELKSRYNANPEGSGVGDTLGDGSE